MERIEKIPAKAGCMGCVYENDQVCPADTGQGKPDFSMCTEENQAIIFVKTKEPNNKG